MATIAYLGTGAWGFCLMRLLAKKGHKIKAFSIQKELIQQLQEKKEHPYLIGMPLQGDVTFTLDLKEALKDCEIVIESVTAEGIRPVFSEIKKIGLNNSIPIILTSKGIEQSSDLILSEVVVSILGEEYRNSIGSFSGPSFAMEVAKELPTACVATGYSDAPIKTIIELFTTNFLRVYPCYDVKGVAFGGSLKNIIAIACGIADGMNLGSGAKAALMTRGLHEIVRLATKCGCKEKTLYGLSGMGDLFLTCSSTLSRNFKFGQLLSKGLTETEAKKEIGMVVEGSYSVFSAMELAKKYNVSMPITEAINNILKGKLSPQGAVGALMQRPIKEEAL